MPANNASITPMKYLSVFSGIEAASIAFEPLGWTPLAYSEIDPFPCAVLQYHWPHVPNLGDINHFASWPEEIFAEADVIVGGSPCQAFSVSGLRGGLSDERGQLTLAYVSLIHHADAIRRKHGKQPATVIWENVAGVLTSADNAFGFFLGGLCGEIGALEPSGAKWSNAGGVFGPTRDIAWRVLDAQHFGVPQRRRRIFAVSTAGGISPPEILFEPACQRGAAKAGQEAPRERRGTTNAPVGNSATSPSLQTKSGIASTLTTDNNGDRSSPRGDGTDNLIVDPITLTVRRLTCEESERFQGFPAGHTRISWRGKMPEDCPDGPRQKAIGNSMAIPVMRKIGEWIQNN